MHEPTAPGFHQLISFLSGPLCLYTHRRHAHDMCDNMTDTHVEEFGAHVDVTELVEEGRQQAQSCFVDSTSDATD